MDRAPRKDIPAGAVVMNRREALNFLWEKILHHEPVRDVIAIKYGSILSGGIASLGGFVMLRHFRKELGLRREAAFSSNIFCLFLPCISTFVYHFMYITPPILLQDKYCKVCLELKSVAIQTGLGFFWPWGLSLISATMTATKLGVYMPTFAQPLQLIKLSWHMAKQGNAPATFIGVLVCNAVGAVILVHAEEAQVLTFRRRMQIRRELPDD